MPTEPPRYDDGQYGHEPIIEDGRAIGETYWQAQRPGGVGLTRHEGWHYVLTVGRNVYQHGPYPSRGEAVADALADRRRFPQPPIRRKPTD